MAYGITSRSQMIDVNSIRSGCQALVDALEDFETCGSLVCTAGETCTKKALSVDEASLEGQITEIGEQIKELKTTYTQYAEDLVREANNIYSQQENEYANYLAQLEAEKQNNN